MLKLKKRKKRKISIRRKDGSRVESVVLLVAFKTSVSTLSRRKENHSILHGVMKIHKGEWKKKKKA